MSFSSNSRTEDLSQMSLQVAAPHHTTVVKASLDALVRFDSAGAATALTTLVPTLSDLKKSKGFAVWVWG
jgi:hypothetical protein